MKIEVGLCQIVHNCPTRKVLRCVQYCIFATCNYKHALNNCVCVYAIIYVQRTIILWDTTCKCTSTTETYRHICWFTHPYAYVYLHQHNIYVHVHTHTHTHTTGTHHHAGSHILMYMYTFISTTFTYMSTHTHTHTHTHSTGTHRHAGLHIFMHVYMMLLEC